MASHEPPDVFSDEADRSIVIPKLICDSCFEDGQSFQAEGYCVDCSHYLCKLCYKHHRNAKPCRNHKLLDNRQMPKTKPPTLYQDECTERCDRHKNEKVSFFCEDHNKFWCMVCITLEHRNCNVGYIPKLSENLFENDEYKLLKSKLESLSERLDEIKDAAKRNLESFYSKADKAVIEIRAFRKTIEEEFDSLEQELIDKVSSSRYIYENEIEDMLKKCETLSKDTYKLMDAIKEKESKKQKCKLYFDTKLLPDKLDQYYKEVSELKFEESGRDIAFHESGILVNLLRNQLLPEKFGMVVTIQEHIDIDDTNDEDDLELVTGIVPLGPHGRVMVDRNKKSIRLLHHSMKTEIASKALQHSAWGITLVKFDNEPNWYPPKIAVIQKGNIEIYQIDTYTNEITLHKTIKNAGFDEKAFVHTYGIFIGVTRSYPPKVQIVDEEGGLIQTFPSQFCGRDLFLDPQFFALHTDRIRIYVSDRGTNTVSCIRSSNIKGESEVVACYKYSDGPEPRGLAVSWNGIVYVYTKNELQDYINILTSNLQMISMLSLYKYTFFRSLELVYIDDEVHVVGKNNSEISITFHGD